MPVSLPATATGTTADADVNYATIGGRHCAAAATFSTDETSVFVAIYEIKP